MAGTGRVDGEGHGEESERKGRITRRANVGENGWGAGRAQLDEGIYGAGMADGLRCNELW